jgi:hypothetical protein
MANTGYRSYGHGQFIGNAANLFGERDWLFLLLIMVRSVGVSVHFYREAAISFG